MQKTTKMKKIKEDTLKKIPIAYEIENIIKANLFTLIQVVEPKQRLRYFITIKVYLSKEGYAFALKTTYLKTSGLNYPDAPIKEETKIPIPHYIQEKNETDGINLNFAIKEALAKSL